ncbi:MAG TPA: hypothetical protein VJ529_05035 [Candidatus Bathyarchaeia archaeon]|nr:hypothetical protein [Candidatus Bathyarchaeia archaeon]
MRKTLLYLTAAVVLGVLATLTPLFVLTLVHQEQYGSAQLFGGFRSLEEASSPSNQSQSYISDFAVLTVSFVVAILLFLLVRKRVPRDFSRPRFPPY